MNILSVHNRYIYRGGEDESSELEASMLRSRGHCVVNYVEDNHEIPKRSLTAVGLGSIWSGKAYSQIRGLIARNRIDLVKVDNFFPLVSPAVFYAAFAEHVPTLQMLRNFRLLCPAATFFRDGAACEDCLRHKLPWPSIVNGCYHKSRLLTLGPALMTTVHRLVGTWKKFVTAYVVLSPFSRDKFIEGGLPAEKIFVKPNFVQDTGPGSGDGGYALFVGRLSEEKGIEVLLGAWKILGKRLQLKVVGDGPLQEKVKQAAAANLAIEYLGQRPLKETYALMGNARVLLFPSLWYETFGRTIAEAFAKGTPVIASNLGTMKTMVSHQRTGLHFEPSNPESLAAQVEWMLAHPVEWGRLRGAARQEYEDLYTEERNYEILMRIYDWAIAHNGRGGQAGRSPNKARPTGAPCA